MEDLAFALVLFAVLVVGILDAIWSVKRREQKDDP